MPSHKVDGYEKKLEKAGQDFKIIKIICQYKTDVMLKDIFKHPLVLILCIVLALKFFLFIAAKVDQGGMEIGKAIASIVK